MECVGSEDSCKG